MANEPVRKFSVISVSDSDETVDWAHFLENNTQCVFRAGYGNSSGFRMVQMLPDIASDEAPFWFTNLTPTGQVGDPAMYAKSPIVSSSAIKAQMFVSAKPSVDPADYADEELVPKQVVQSMIGGSPGPAPVPGRFSPPSFNPDAHDLTLLTTDGQAAIVTTQPDVQISEEMSNDGRYVKSNSNEIRMITQRLIDAPVPFNTGDVLWTRANEHIEKVAITSEEAKVNWYPNDTTEDVGFGSVSYFRRLSVPAYSKHLGLMKGSSFTILPGSANSNGYTAPQTILSSDLIINPTGPVISPGTTEATDAKIDVATKVNINTDVTFGLDDGSTSNRATRIVICRRLNQYQTNILGQPQLTVDPSADDELVTIGMGTDNGIMELISKIATYILAGFKAFRVFNNNLKGEVLKIDHPADAAEISIISTASDINIGAAAPVVNPYTNSIEQAPTTFNVNALTYLNLTRQRPFTIQNITTNGTEELALLSEIDGVNGSFFQFLSNLWSSIQRGLEVAGPYIIPVLKVVGKLAALSSNDVEHVEVNGNLIISDRQLDANGYDTSTQLTVKTHSAFELGTNKTFKISGKNGTSDITLLEFTPSATENGLFDWISKALLKLKNGFQVISDTGIKVLEIVKETVDLVRINADKISVNIREGHNNLWEVWHLDPTNDISRGIRLYRKAWGSAKVTTFLCTADTEFRNGLKVYHVYDALSPSFVLRSSGPNPLTQLVGDVEFFQDTNGVGSVNIMSPVQATNVNQNDDTEDTVDYVATHKYVKTHGGYPMSLTPSESNPYIRHPIELTTESTNYVLKGTRITCHAPAEAGPGFAITGYENEASGQEKGFIRLYGTKGADGSYGIYSWYSGEGHNTGHMIDYSGSAFSPATLWLDASPDGLKDLLIKDNIGVPEGTYLQRTIDKEGDMYIMTDHYILKYKDGTQFELGSHKHDITKQFTVYLNSPEYQREKLRKVLLDAGTSSIGEI